MIRIAVLYEDQLAISKPRAFGPHVLLLACVADRLQRPREHLEQHVDAHPCKGIGRLLDAVRHVLGRDPLADKPSPLRRASILLHLAYQGAPEQRLALQQRVPSFAYLSDCLARTIVELGL